MGNGKNLISMFEGFRGEGASGPGAQALQAAIGDAPIPRTAVFDFQSELDATYRGNAVHDQKASQQIVLPQQANESGYGIALAPWSETPVAVRFRSGGAQGGSAVCILRPGDVIFPSRSRPFSGFEWGLPFGWLGGGLATIAILPSPETDLGWGGTRREILFQRFQALINPIAGIVGNAAFEAMVQFNWPTRFPFVQQRRQDAAATYDQSGQPCLAVEPTRTVLVLHPAGGALGAAATMRAMIVRPSGTTAPVAYPPYVSGANEVIAEDITWGGPWAQLGAAVAYPQLPTIELTTGILVSQHGDNAGVCGLVLVSDAGAVLDNLLVDILRYGKL